jgi:hypothetical protein
VRQVQSQFETEESSIDEATSAYCQARARIPLERFHQAMEESAQAADKLACPCCAEEVLLQKRNCIARLVMAGIIKEIKAFNNLNSYINYNNNNCKNNN